MHRRASRHVGQPRTIRQRRQGFGASLTGAGRSGAQLAEPRVNPYTARIQAPLRVCLLEASLPQTKSIRPHSVPKVSTGIRGLDELTNGGLPRGRATLILGGPGAGKTLLALQTVVHAVATRGEPAIFVTCEEDPERLAANAASFGWDLPRLARKGLHFLDARPSPDLIRTGGFDLIGLLAMLGAKAERTKARWVVIDSIDMLLNLLPDARAATIELLRLHEWLVEHGFTAILTSKVRDGVKLPSRDDFSSEMEFLVDCAIVLTHRVTDGTSLRHLRIRKFRGSGFAENEAPLLITPDGIEVAGVLRELPTSASSERVSTGVPQLDEMIGGGYYRGAGILITGAPGTAKSTVAGAFAEAACARGEGTLFLSFDSGAAETVRNLASVGIRLERFRRRKLLHMLSASQADGSPEVHFQRIRRVVREHGIRCLVIDPVSTFGKHDTGTASHAVVERLTRWAKGVGLTLLCTSLTDGAAPELEGTQMQISTIADTWIHLSYRVHAGERNRAITIIKSRGSSHSNQVRELILSDEGLTLAEVFTAGGEVLMGTMRWEREEAMREEAARRAGEDAHRAAELLRSEEELTEQLRHLKSALEAKQAERRALLAHQAEGDASRTARTAGTRTRRQAKAPANPSRR